MQIRPIVSKDESVNIDLEGLKTDNTLIVSKSALGNCIIKNIFDFVYVRPQNFDASKTKEIAGFINELVSHLRFMNHLTIIIDGKKNLGVVYKPDNL